MQGFGKRTRTDIALGLLGVLVLESEIDKKNLSILGQLCRNDTHCWITPVFHIRLNLYYVNRNVQIGFFSDIMRLLEKHGLTGYIESFRIRGGFPTKLVWNKLVKQRIHQYETVEWQNRISDADFSSFSRLHNVHEPHIFWYGSKENSHISRCYKSMMQMIAYLSNYACGPFTCSYCKSQYVNLVQHCIHKCRYLDAERIIMVTNVQLFDAAVYFFYM